MKSFAALTALAAVVVAQSNPLIPSGISSGCSSFMSTLDDDSTLASCLSTLVGATKQFGPAANATGTQSAATIATALGSLCASTTCSESAIRGQLASFYSACTAELVTSPNADVLAQYDTLYTLVPLKGALCAQESGAYCVNSLVKSTNARRSLDTRSVAGVLYVPAAHHKRADDTQVVLKPNVTTYRAENIAFLTLQPTTAAATLCSNCARDVMESYIDFMNLVPYAPGIKSSPILGGQPDLYQAQVNTCPSDFFSSSTVQNAGGGLAGGLTGSTDGAARSMATAAGALAGMLGAAFIAL
ncbi:hypothetical protein OF83DRAFT_820969 [Amylostereum chailletii]|nr:hypothetical protein OF83DRAFT_820969 [Amylostereum chailletii]